MSKLEETKMLIDYVAKLQEAGLTVDNIVVVLLDIAKSLAMITDKLCDTESEDKT